MNAFAAARRSAVLLELLSCMLCFFPRSLHEVVNQVPRMQVIFYGLPPSITLLKKKGPWDLKMV